MGRRLRLYLHACTLLAAMCAIWVPAQADAGEETMQLRRSDDEARASNGFVPIAVSALQFAEPGNLPRLCPRSGTLASIGKSNPPGYPESEANMVLYVMQEVDAALSSKDSLALPTPPIGWFDLAMPPPQEPFDTTPITPVETVGAAVYEP